MYEQRRVTNDFKSGNRGRRVAIKKEAGLVKRGGRAKGGPRNPEMGGGRDNMIDRYQV